MYPVSELVRDVLTSRLFLRLKPKTEQKPDANPESGSVLTVLLVGVGMAAALSLVLYHTVSGPMSSMVRITNKTSAKSQMQTAANIVIMDAFNQPSNGDCDGDGAVEPRAWRAGTIHPVNGGLIPNTIGAQVADPWGTDYGYCVWDVGPDAAHVKAAGCDTVANGDVAAQNARRLSGATDPTGSSVSQTVLAVISAGPNRKFETTCNSYVNGTTDEITTGGDDVVQRYTYQEAASATSALWTLKAGDSTKAVIAKDLEIGAAGAPTVTIGSGSGLVAAKAATFTSDLVVANGGAVIGAIADAACDPAQPGVNAGLMRYNNGDIQYCNNTGHWSGGGSGVTAFSFTDVTLQPISSTATSNTVTLQGSFYKADATCGAGCSALSINGGAWSPGPTLASSQDTIAIRQMSSASYNAATTAVVTVGSTTSGPWSVTTTPQPSAFSFADVTLQAVSTLTTSNTVTLAGGFTNLAATCGGACTAIARNGVWGGASVAGFNSGDTIAIRQTSSASYNTATTATVIVGTAGSTTSGTWTVTTTPTANAFSFTDQTLAALGTLTTSNTVTLAGGFTNLTATCGGGCSAISKNGAAFVAGPVAGFNSGDTIAIQLTSSGSYNTAVTATVTVGGTTSGSWSVTTTPTASAFSFTDQTLAALGTLTTSDTVALAGGFTNLTATCNAGCSAISIQGAAFAAGPASGVNSGNTIAIRLTSSASYNTAVTATVTVGGTTSGVWSVTTTPTATAFSFTNQTGVALSTATTSNTVTLAGGFSGLTATCTGCTLSIGGGAFVASQGAVNSGDTIAIKLTSSGAYSTAVTATVTVGGTTSGTWSVTTTPTASAFSFTDQTGVALSTAITSNTVTLAGGFSNLTATCGGSCSSIAINGGAFAAGPFTGVNSGDTIAIRLTSSASYSTAVTATITVGGTTSGTWSVTTMAAPTLANQHRRNDYCGRRLPHPHLHFIRNIYRKRQWKR